MNILVTGGSGVLGRKIVAYFSEKKIRVTSIVRKPLNSQWPNENIIFSEQLDELSSHVDSDTIVIHNATHYVAEHKPEHVDNLILSNVLYGVKILEQLKLLGVRKFINIGTDWQSFQGEERAPVNLYAATKQAFDDLLSYYCAAYGFGAVTLRLSDTFCEGDSRRKLLDYIIESYKNDIEIELSPGEQLLNLVHMGDVLTAIDLAANTHVKEFEHAQFSLVGPDTYTIKDIVYLIESLGSKKIKVKFGARKYREREVMVPTHLRSLPGWHPSRNIQQYIMHKLNDGLNE